MVQPFIRQSELPSQVKVTECDNPMTKKFRKLNAAYGSVDPAIAYLLKQCISSYKLTVLTLEWTTSPQLTLKCKRVCRAKEYRTLLRCFPRYPKPFPLKAHGNFIQLYKCTQNH